MKIRNVRAVLCVLAACGVAANHKSGTEIAQSAVGHPFGLACGHSDPEINRVASAALQQVPQEYEGSGRRLSSFISVHNATDIVPIRIQIVWDNIVSAGGFESSAGSRINRTCLQTGQIIQVDAASGSQKQAYTCKDVDVVHPSSRKFVVMRRRTEWAVQRWASMLSVKRTQNPIVVSSNLAARFGLATQAHANVDLVVVMTAWPSPNKPIAGYASGIQADQHHRSTVGHFNWIPAVISEYTDFEPTTIEGERHTALHELAHIFGAVFVGPHFISADSGQPMHPSNVAVVEPDSTAYPKTVTKIITPRVVAHAKEAFGCQSITGVPIEDVPLGKGAHWESRVLGPELMSYGSHAGEAYVSDLTLAFLEDTNQYIANYSNAGILIEPPAVEYKEATSVVSFMQTSSAQIVTPPEPLTPGYLRWGRGAGCDFVQSGPASWPERYTCSANQEYACTPDYRASAVCMLKIDIREPAAFTCGAVNEFSSGAVTYWRATCPAGTNDACDAAGTCRLPSMYQYFGSNADDVAPLDAGELFPNSAGSFAVTSPTIGGVSASMDYVPVRVKYWNCAFKQGASTDAGNRTSEEGAAIDSSLFGKKSDMALFGGQEQCPECRCFVSSLVEFTKGFNPKFPRYGLCYRANCFRNDYLQVGVRGIASSSIFWYKCPTAGGKIYITGFSGALHCPPATEFCAMQTISGVKFPETDRFMEFVFWMAVLGGALLFVIVCMFGKVRQRAGLCGKVWCGVMHFDLDLRTGRDLEEVMAIYEEWEPQPCPSLALRTINGLLMLVSASVGTAGAYLVSQQLVGLPMVSPILCMAFGLFMLGGLGYVSATSSGRGVSCTVLMYMFAANLVLLGSMYVVVAYAGDVSLDAYVDHHFDTLCLAFNNQDEAGCNKAAATPALRAEKVEDITAEMESNLGALLGVIGGLLALVLSGSITAARIVDWDVLVATSFTVVNYAATFLGFALAAGASWFAAAYGSGSVAFSLSVTAGVAGVWFAALGIVGLVGAFRLWQKRLVAHMVLSAITCVGSVAIGAAMLANLSQLDGEVDKRDDEELGRLMAQFGRTMSRDELKAALENAVRMLGIAMCALGLVCAAMALMNFFFARIMRPFKVQVKEVRKALKAAGEAPQDEDSDDEQIALGGTNVMFVPQAVATAAAKSARHLGESVKHFGSSVRKLSTTQLPSDGHSNNENPLAEPSPAATGATAPPEAAAAPTAAAAGKPAGATKQ